MTVGARKKSIVYGTGEEQTREVLTAYEELSKAVRGLADLPLMITTLHGVHPVFRHTEVSLYRQTLTSGTTNLILNDVFVQLRYQYFSIYTCCLVNMRVLTTIFSKNDNFYYICTRGT